MVIRVEVRRGLNIHLAAQQEPRHRYGLCDIHCIGFVEAGHSGVRLRAKVLNDDFLNVSELFVQIANRNQAVHAFFESFADADQNPRRERDRKLTRFANHAQPDRRMFVGGREMRHSPLREPGA